MGSALQIEPKATPLAEAQREAAAKAEEEDGKQSQRNKPIENEVDAFLLDPIIGGRAGGRSNSKSFYARRTVNDVDQREAPPSARKGHEEVKKMLSFNGNLSARENGSSSNLSVKKQRPHYYQQLQSFFLNNNVENVQNENELQNYNSNLSGNLGHADISPVNNQALTDG